MACENKKTNWTGILFNEKKGTKSNPVGEHNTYDKSVEEEAKKAEENYKKLHDGKTNPNGPDGGKKEEAKKEEEAEQ